MDSERSAINLYNIARGRLIEGAPIKGQCARNYFYGKDGLLERALQEPESAYAAIVAKATNDPHSITLKDLAHLREFALLQTFRTYGHIEKFMAAADQHYADIEAAAKGMRLPPRMVANVDEAVIIALRQFADTREHVRDLETCLILNETRHEFITSDDPVIHTNRFHFQKLRKDSFGICSAGAMFFLPLTPKLAFMAFDGNVYLAPRRLGNTVGMGRNDEVSSLNELQLLHARQNLYFADSATGEKLVTEFRRHAVRRPKVWNKFTYSEKVGESDEAERFKRVEALTLEPGRSYLTALQPVHVQPSRWTGFLKYRLRPRFIDTGTAAGYLRPNHPRLRKWTERHTAEPKKIIVSDAK